MRKNNKKYREKMKKENNDINKKVDKESRE